MTYDTTLTVQTASILKRKAKKKLASHGLSITEVVNEFLQHIVDGNADNGLFDGVILHARADEDVPKDVLKSLKDMKELKSNHPKQFVTYTNKGYVHS